MFKCFVDVSFIILLGCSAMWGKEPAEVAGPAVRSQAWDSCPYPEGSGRALGMGVAWSGVRVRKVLLAAV